MSVLSWGEDPYVVSYLKRHLWPELLSYTYSVIVLRGKWRLFLVTHSSNGFECLSTEATVGDQGEEPAGVMLIVTGRERTIKLGAHGQTVFRW